jgi:hypothetical protein
MKAKREKNLDPTKSLAEKAFSREYGMFGSKLARQTSVQTSPDLGEVTNGGDIGTTRRPGSSAPRSKAANVSSETDWQAGEVPKNLRSDG